MRGRRCSGARLGREAPPSMCAGSFDSAPGRSLGKEPRPAPGAASWPRLLVDDADGRFEREALPIVQRPRARDAVKVSEDQLRLAALRYHAALAHASRP